MTSPTGRFRMRDRSRQGSAALVVSIADVTAADITSYGDSILLQATIAAPVHFVRDDAHLVAELHEQPRRQLRQISPDPASPSTT